jgi:hypothetical protein
MTTWPPPSFTTAAIENRDALCFGNLATSQTTAQHLAGDNYASRFAVWIDSRQALQ